MRKPRTKNEIQITWLGHAAFELLSPGGTDILIDPFLTKNPATPAEFKDLSRYHPNYILVTHSHGDHLGDAVELAKMSKAKIVSVYMPEPFKKGELARELIEPVNVGDNLTLGDVKVHVVPAMHSSEPSGRPVGYILEFADGRAVYHEGDTWIFRRHGIDPGILSSEYYSNAGRRSSRWAKPADGVAGGEALFQAANCYSNALRCADGFID
jgi:L-ascorbate metabolism protein UlaG (beta-lactamase superfamily)